MDTFWDDDVDFSEWRVVLVDFGFARVRLACCLVASAYFSLQQQ